MREFVEAFLLGGRVASERLSWRTALFVPGATIAFCALAGWHSALADPDANRALTLSQALWGHTFGLAIPIASAVLVARVFSRTRPDTALASLGLLGANRRAAALGALAVTSLLAAETSMLAAAFTVAVAQGQGGPPWSLDVAVSAWIGALVGGAYVFYFGAASTIGRRGGGRIWAFFMDWLMGPLGGIGAVVLPRSHAINLLGGTPVIDLPQRVSATTLVGLAVMYAALAAIRTKP